MLVSIIFQKLENQKNQLGCKPQNIMPSSLAFTQNGYLVKHMISVLLEMMLHIMQINTYVAGKVVEWYIKVQHNVTWVIWKLSATKMLDFKEYSNVNTLHIECLYHMTNRQKN